MKILQMRLLAFGPFTESVIDLGEGEEGLHIVYGPNEAGKSSALRALRQMLYGIPDRSSDAFLHPYAKMRIGGVIRHSDGTVVEFVRRKGRVNALRAGDDETLLDESLLYNLLGGIDAELFSNMFGIGHLDLVRGGEEIIRGGGNVGQALFAAGSGISDLRKIQIDLQAEAEALFTPSASKRQINVAIADFKRNQKDLRDMQLPGQEWARHDQALRDASKHKGRVNRELEEKQKERHRLERIKEALPAIARRKELLNEFRSYADAIILPADFADRRRELLTDLRVAENEKAQSLKSIEEIDNTLNELEVPECILEHAEMIERFYQGLGSHNKAEKDRTRLLTERKVLESDAKEIIASLRRDITLEQAGELQLEKAETIRILELGTRYERLATRLEDSQEEISKLSVHINRLERQSKKLEKPRNANELQRVLKRALQQGNIEQYYNTECEEIRSSQNQAEIALKKQTLWQGSLESLEKLPIPPLETIEAFENQLDQAQGMMTRIGTEIHELEDTIVEVEGEIEQLRLEQEVPSEEDLQKTRQRRDQGWKLVRRAWQEAHEQDEHVQDYISSFEYADTLTEAYELSVKQADDLADRLRREADRVARKATLIADREKRGRKLENLKDQLNTAEAELEKITKQWSEVWEGIGISPRSPREMRSWAQNQMALAEQVSSIRQRKAKAEEFKTRIEAHRQELNQCLKSLNEPPANKDETLLEITERGQQVIERQDRLRVDREKHLHEKQQRQEELREAELRVEKTEQELSRWRIQWEQAIHPLGLQADASPAQASAVIEDIKNLFDKLKQADILRKRIEGMDRDAETFSENVTKLAERIAQDLLELPVEQAASELNARLTRTRSAKTRQQGLEVRHQGENEKLESARNKIMEIESQLASMCEEAGCSSYEKLPEAEERSAKRRQIESQLVTLEDQLHKLSAGATIEGFVKEAQEVDPDGIDGQTDRLGEDIDALNREKSELDQTIGSERTELGKMDGSARAADLAEETQMILGRLESGVEQYVRLRLASAVLAQAIERYREKHQEPILERTNDLFSRLTLSSFEGIRVEFDEQANPVLVGVRNGGKEIVGVEGMSDGTTDQLYLALRLASLETYLEKNEPIPFIVDDILIKFDNERATAALQVLSELAKKTQVIFFTHHRHLVALAEANVAPSVLFKHTLGI